MYSNNVSKYYVIFTDDYSPFSLIYFLAHKSDVLIAFTQFQSQIDNLLSRTREVLISDG